MANATVEKRTPLKAPPLRQAGESVEQEIGRLLDDQASGWILLLVGLPILTLLMVFYWWIGATLPLIVLTFGLMTLAASPLCIVRSRRLKRQIKDLKLGRDGERIVGRYLDEQLLPRGYRVFHDVLAQGTDGTIFNVDHVAIGPGGVFVIETKTRSKPRIGDPVVEYDGRRFALRTGRATRRPFDKPRRTPASYGTCSRRRPATVTFLSVRSSSTPAGGSRAAAAAGRSGFWSPRLSPSGSPTSGRIYPASTSPCTPTASRGTSAIKKRES